MSGNDDIANELVAMITEALGGGGRGNVIITDGLGHILTDTTGKQKRKPKKYRITVRCEGGSTKGESNEGETVSVVPEHTEILGSSNSIQTAMQIYIQSRALIEFMNPCWCGAGLNVFLEVRQEDDTYRIWKHLWSHNGGDQCINGFKYGRKYV